MWENSGGSHPHAVWSGKNSLGKECLLAVRCWVFMGLQEGFCKPAYEIGGEIRVMCGKGQVFHKGKVRGFHGRKHAKPFLFLGMPEAKPAVELVACDGKTLQELFYCMDCGKVFRENAQDEEKSIPGVRNDEVREDGMGMSTSTDQT